MKATLSDAELTTPQVIRAEFAEVIEKSWPQGRPTHGTLSLTALLDDGTLKTLASLGEPHTTSQVRYLWSDPAWSALARENQAGGLPHAVATAESTLIPITVDCVLYGAIELRGPLPEEWNSAEACSYAATTLAPAVIAAVRT